MYLDSTRLMFCDSSTLQLTAVWDWERRWIHLGGRGVVFSCHSCDRTCIPYVRMGEKQNYEFCLTAIIGRPCCEIDNGNFSQATLVPHVNFVCLYFSLSSAWFLHRCSYWRDGLGFDHRFYNGVLIIVFFLVGRT